MGVVSEQCIIIALGSRPTVCNITIVTHILFTFLLTMQDVLSNDGVAEAFRSQTISVTNSQHSSRTYYMVAPSEQERENWVESITKNFQSYAVSICAVVAQPPSRPLTFV